MNIIGDNSFKSITSVSNTDMLLVEEKTDIDEEKNSDNDKKSGVDCFEELCKRFPFASFVVEDISVERFENGWLPKEYLQNVKLGNFSELGTTSIAFDIKILEKASNDPEFMETLINEVDCINKRWLSMATQCQCDGMRYMYMNLFLREDGSFGSCSGEYPDKVYSYSNYKENLLESQNDSVIKQVLDEYEKKRQEGLYHIVDKIYENSEKIEISVRRGSLLNALKTERYEETFLFSDEK